MIANYEVDITDFVKITNNGIYTADYSQIRSALIQRYKSIYGEDIDLSTGSADGIWIADQALIINNICQVVKGLYSNMDVNTASGVYLDALCRLSNVRRKPATKSIARLVVTNQLNKTRTFDTGLTFVDKAGMEWTYNSPISFVAYESKAITVTCDEVGEIQAPAGWINQTIALENLTVEQNEPAEIGSNEENDSELRARRNSTNSLNAVTVLESLVSALMNLSGIEDVKIYNNNTFVDKTCDDGTTIEPASIYVIIREREGITIDSSIIGNVIYQKLTPGISTTETADATGINESHEYVPYVRNARIVGFNQTVYWKKATPLNPTLKILIAPEAYFSIDEFDEIVSGAQEYLNNLPISEEPNLDNLKAELMYSDPTFKGNKTFTLSSVSFLSSAVNNDRYFYYSKYSTLYNGTITDGTNTYNIKGGEFTIDKAEYKLYNNCISYNNDSQFISIINQTFELNDTTYKVNVTSVTKYDDKYVIDLS